MKTLTNFRNLIFTVIILFNACEKPDEIIISEDPILLNELYSISVDTLRIEENKYFIFSFIYRDFMPTVPYREKSPLIAVIELVDFDSIEVSNDLDISKLYVINGNKIWISEPKKNNLPYSAYKIQAVSNNGPEWETGIYVDVVAEISNTKTLDKSLLILKQQCICRTE